MLDKLRWKFYRFVRRIKWLPVIWRDEQWDEFYLLKILSFKFKLMEEFHLSKYAVAADREKIAKQIRICRLLCDRLIKEDYIFMLDVDWGGVRIYLVVLSGG